MPEPEKLEGLPASDLARWRYWECADCGESISCKYVQVPGRMEPSFCPVTKALCPWREKSMPLDFESTKIRATQKLDQLLQSWRYIIAEIGKLKVSVEDFKGCIEKANFPSIAGAMAEMRALIETTAQAWNQGGRTVEELAAVVSQLAGTANKIYEGVRNERTTKKQAET